MTKVDANQFLFFPEFRMALLKAIQDGHTVLNFEHTSGEGTGYGGGKRLDLEFEARITKINGEAVPRITQRMLQKAKKAK